MTRDTQGFALIDLIFCIGVITLLFSIAAPRLLLAKQAAGSASAIGSMRAINSGQLTFAITCGNGFYAPNLTTLGTPPLGSREAFITPGLGGSNTVAKTGYVIQVSATPFAGAPASCNGVAAGAAGQGYKAAADPSEPGNVRFLATNANGLIYEHSSSLLASMPEVGSPSTGTALH
jgi:type IV pilus assembly protein PilA